MKIPRRPWMTDREYRANKDGLNIVFGAVLGFVLAGTEDMDTTSYSIMLVCSAIAVVIIFYIGASAYRKTYALLALAYIAVFPMIIDLASTIRVPPNLQATLLIWWVFVTTVELVPRAATSERGTIER